MLLHVHDEVLRVYLEEFFICVTKLLRFPRLNFPGQSLTIDHTESRQAEFRTDWTPYSLDCCGSVVDHDL